MPLPQQIAEHLRTDIRSGKLVPGQLIPSEFQLVEQYGVCRQTVRCAVALLRDEGAVYTIRAEGSYVSPKTAPKLRPPQKCEQIADHLREQISSGHLRPGERLPTETRLAGRYGVVARDTVRAAIALLRDDRHVQTVPRRGTFVVSPGKAT
ncbi:regulatory protein, gntR family [Sinosporangium album]|uniref:Regulatory protein, gntR family n=1 Tax=Sinosporangium album TaxID=504805 RepID=A0A1G8K0Y4_9ACTN|nr:GntR family transcriptional regulator [Sinosporangium album]SDI37017.1 regulatory protein, gntR family [Sinosporangium album]